MANFNRYYQSSYWQTKRRWQLRRQPFCVECKKENTLTFATVADHIIPHKGDWALFCKDDNLQSLCSYHHGLKSQKEK